MLTLVWLMYVSFGMTTRVIAPLVTPIINDLNLTYGQMGSILGSWQLAYIVVAVATGLLVDRFGIRRTIGLGIIVIALSGFSRMFAVSYETMFAAVLIFGIGGPTISIGAPKLISVWFKGNDRRTAAGIYTTGTAVGAIFALSSVNSVIMPWLGSWRLTFLFFSLIVMAMSILWWALAREPSRTYNVSQTEKHELPFKDALVKLVGIRNVWIIVVVGFSNFLVGHGLMNWLPKMIEATGMAPEQAGYLASIPSAVGIPAAFLITRGAPESKGRFVAALLFFLASISTYLIGTTTGISLVGALIVQGMARGALLPLFMLILMNTPEVGSRLMGAAGGLFFTVGEVGGFAGPYLMGLLVDITGSFYAGILLLTILTVTMIPPLLLVKEPKRKH